jgi:16S rRNA (cytidine1402-2'-O)-methyltransferase
VGKIILLNTPIGNLGDLTPRVLEALKEGVHFAAEDTRVLKELLNHLGLSVQGKRIFALHEHSSEGEVRRLLENLPAGETLYVTSDAGSPMISDPAYPLLKIAIEENFEIDSYSGISSPIMALELSGLPPIPFHFHGFLPREKGKVASAFSSLTTGTHIFFEAPTRILSTLENLSQTTPEAEVCVVRELSKKFQQVLRFKAREFETRKDELTTKGEFVLLIHQPKSGGAQNSQELTTLAQEIYEGTGGPKGMAKLLSLILNIPSKEIYSKLNKKS